MDGDGLNPNTSRQNRRWRTSELKTIGSKAYLGGFLECWSSRMLFQCLHKLQLDSSKSSQHINQLWDVIRTSRQAIIEGMFLTWRFCRTIINNPEFCGFEANNAYFYCSLFQLLHWEPFLMQVLEWCHHILSKFLAFCSTCDAWISGGCSRDCNCQELVNNHSSKEIRLHISHHCAFLSSIGIHLLLLLEFQ